MFMLCKYFLLISVTVIYQLTNFVFVLTILIEKGWGEKSEQMLYIYLELLCFVKYDVPTEYLTLFSWFAMLVNQCFNSKEFERCKIWTMFTSVGPFVMSR